MATQRESETPAAGNDGDVFFFEIRVKSRLSPDQWTAWFDDLAVSANERESVLRGKAVDRAMITPPPAVVPTVKAAVAPGPRPN